jgi:hypothetical protein
MLRQFRRIVVAVAGSVVLAIGVAMLVLPGPAIIVIPTGLAILATEFQWAQRLLHRMRKRVEGGLTLFKRRTPPPPPPSAPDRSNKAPDDRSALVESSRSSKLRAS